MQASASVLENAVEIAKRWTLFILLLITLIGQKNNEIVIPVYHMPVFEAWKVPKRPVEVSCDVTSYLVAYQTAVET